MSRSMEITDINVTMPLSDFESALNAEISNYPCPMHFSIASVPTKRGKNMYKVIVENATKSVFTIIAEQDDANGDIMFHPLIMQSINNSFYQTLYYDSSCIGNDEDPALFFSMAMSTIAKQTNGTFACFNSDGTKIIISNGDYKTIRSGALVDSDGNVYSCSGAKKIGVDTGDSNFSVNQPIGEWLNEHKDIQTAIAKMPLNQKMDYIGKWLIQARLKEEIESSEFMDIFCQAGILGFSDSSVQYIYKLLM